jgi:hypothetical protein
MDENSHDSDDIADLSISLHDKSTLQASSFFFLSMTVVTHLPLCLNPRTGKRQS